MEIVINDDYGGFSLSHKAVIRYAELSGIKLYPWLDEIAEKVYKEKATLDNLSCIVHYTKIPKEEWRKINEEESEKPVEPGRYEKSNSLYFSDRDILRTDPILMQVIREMGKDANGRCASFKIIEIPDGIDWKIEEYDGLEWVAEKHRTWS